MHDRLTGFGNQQEREHRHRHGRPQQVHRLRVLRLGLPLRRAATVGGRGQDGKVQLLPDTRQGTSARHAARLRGNLPDGRDQVRADDSSRNRGTDEGGDESQRHDPRSASDRSRRATTLWRAELIPLTRRARTCHRRPRTPVGGSACGFRSAAACSLLLRGSMRPSRRRLREIC
jgi:hypothetical protein